MQLDLVRLIAGIHAVFPRASVVLGGDPMRSGCYQAPTRITVHASGYAYSAEVYHAPTGRDVTLGLVHEIVSQLSCTIASSAINGLRRA